MLWYWLSLPRFKFFDSIVVFSQADVGQDEDFEEARAKATKLGAKKVSDNPKLPWIAT